jgi:rRNA maturation RNase YbeY
MIEFHYEADFDLGNEALYSDWINRVSVSEDFSIGELTFIFCDDKFLFDINRKYLDHDDYTDIITFDYTEGRQLSGDIFISVERVKENAEKYEQLEENEFRRVMAHGALHLMGYGDKKPEEVNVMRSKEEEKMKLFHAEQ